MTLWLGVDMGGTATRWVARGADGAVKARGQDAGATALPDPVARAHYLGVLAQIGAELPAPLSGAVLGLTGSGLTPDSGLIRDTAQALGIAPERVTLLNDMVLAWHTAYPDGHGHLVAAGTGSVGLSMDKAGVMTLVGGRGTLIDDAGSGAWIGLRALDEVWRLIDQFGAPTGAETLARHLFDVMGGSEWDDTRRWVYAGDRGQIAALAPSVAAAAQAGDLVALSILRRAGVELARLAQALIARCGPAPVGLTGGVFGLHPVILSALKATLPDVAVRLLTLDAAAHAAEMAQTRYPLETP